MRFDLRNSTNKEKKKHAPATIMMVAPEVRLKV